VEAGSLPKCFAGPNRCRRVFGFIDIARHIVSRLAGDCRRAAGYRRGDGADDAYVVPVIADAT
jgi:hypothetical protein